MRWPKYWSFSLSVSPSNDYSGLISFRMDWLDLLAVQGTLKSLLQHHNLKSSVLWCSAFFMVHLSHSYMITGKTIALTIWTFIGKVMFLRGIEETLQFQQLLGSRSPMALPSSLYQPPTLSSVESHPILIPVLANCSLYGGLEIPLFPDLLVPMVSQCVPNN